MRRRVFFSFNFEQDAWRVSQVKNMGAVSGQPILTANQFEEVKGGGKRNIKKWIDENMIGKSCVVVLIGHGTAGREWVEYEIKKGWNDGKGVLGVHIHNLENNQERQSRKGRNPFDDVKLANGRRMSSVVRVYDPPRVRSTAVYGYIQSNLAGWVERAIRERQSF